MLKKKSLNFNRNWGLCCGEKGEEEKKIKSMQKNINVSKPFENFGTFMKSNSKKVSMKLRFVALVFLECLSQVTHSVDVISLRWYILLKEKNNNIRKVNKVAEISRELVRLYYVLSPKSMKTISRTTFRWPESSCRQKIIFFGFTLFSNTIERPP